MQPAPGTQSDRNVTGEPAAQAARQTLPPPSGLGLRLLWLIVVLALAAGAYGWLDQRRAMNALQRDVAQRLAEADAAVAQASSRTTALAGRLRDSQSELASVEAQVSAFQTQQASLDDLYRDIAPSRDELALTEIEQILVLASQQLALAGNVQAALTAVQVADAKLAQLDRPQFAPLRRALVHDIDSLKAVPYVDVTGISIRIDQVIASIDALPLARDERVPAQAPPQSPTGESASHRLLRELWAQVRDVVRIEVTDRPAAPLVTPEQSFFLRENLRLRLLSARIALLSRDDRSFKADLQVARHWLDEYFDLNAKPVEMAVATLAQQSAVTMPRELPDLAASLDVVRALKAASERVVDHPPTRRPPGAK